MRIVKGWVQKVSKRVLITLVLVMLFIVLGVAWYDGGQQEQRLIAQPIELPESDT